MGKAKGYWAYNQKMGAEGSTPEKACQLLDLMSKESGSGILVKLKVRALKANVCGVAGGYKPYDSQGSLAWASEGEPSFYGRKAEGGWMYLGL